MMLLTKPIREKLLANAKLPDSKKADLMPVVKFFYPAGAGTWIFTELDENGDTLFGLCDPGLGTPELGYASLSELAEFRGRFGLGIERDMHWTAKKTLREYADEANESGRLIA